MADLITTAMSDYAFTIESKRKNKYIKQIKDQFKQEIIDELDQFDYKLNNSAEFRAGINKAIEIIKSK